MANLSRRSRWSVAIVLVTLTVVLLLSAAPLLLRLGIEQWFNRNGDARVHLGALRIDPRLPGLTLKKIRILQEDREVLAGENIRLTLDLAALRQKVIHLETVDLETIHLDVRLLQQGGWGVGPVHIPAPEPADRAAGTDSEPTDWTLQVDSFRVRNSRVRLFMSGQQLDLEIDEGSMKSFSTDPAAPAPQVTLRGRMGGRPVELNLHTMQFLSGLDVAGSVHCQDLPLSRLALFFPANGIPVAGRVNLQGTFRFARTGKAALRLEQAGQVVLRDAAISLAAVQGTSESIGWNGKLSLVFGNHPRLHMDGTLALKPAKGELASGTFGLGGMQWQGQLTFQSADDSSLDLHGRLSLEDLALSPPSSTPSLSLKARGIDWNGALTYGWGPTVRQSLSLTGKLTATALRGLLPNNQELQQQGLSLEGDFRLENGSTPQGTLSLHSQGLRYTLDGGLSLLEAEVMAVNKLHLQGHDTRVDRILASGLRMEVPGSKGISVSLEDLALEELLFTGIKPSSAASIRMENARLLAREIDGPLISVGTLETEGASTQALQDVSLHRLSLADVGLVYRDDGKGHRQGCQIGEAGASGFHWQPDQGTAATKVQIQNLECWLRWKKDGHLDIIQPLQPLLEQAKQPHSPGTPSPDKRPAFRFDRIVLRGDNRLHYEDQTLVTPFHSDLAITMLDINDIDSSLPEQPVACTLKGKLEKRAPLEVKGTILPFGERLALDLSLSVKNYPLVNLSPYTIETIGRRLGRGRLQTDSTLTIRDGQLQMDNHLVISQLETQTIASDLAARLDSRLPLPLDSAIGLLKDNNDKIVLDIPVSGPLADLEVGISDLLITALSGALVPAASSYLMYTLGPYGALAYVGVKIGGGLMRTRLSPVIYPPGVVQLDEEQKEYARGLARLLQERPAIDLYLCPVVNTSELSPREKKQGKEPSELSEEEKKSLLELGQERARRLSMFLQEAMGIARERLLVCKTRLVTGGKKSRLDLQL